MTAEPVRPVEIFYSYAHEDERLRKQLENHLSLMKQEGLITGWYDREIRAGAEWASEIDTHLNSASIILLLISPDFMASEYCYSVEMKRAIERQHAGEARVIPIILRPVDWERAPFGKLQALPTDAKPVTDWSKRDRAFLNIAKGIRSAISELTSTSSATSTSSPQLWNIPYRRNPFFTGREAILTALHNQLQSGKPAALTQPQAISGLGGIGKTQTAIEYAYRHRNEYYPIFWATAATHESLITDFMTIAGLLNLPEKNAPDSSKAVAAVKRWLSSNKDWLLILDNADDLEMASEFLPTEYTGHVLLTTRAQFTGTIANGIDLEKMDLAEGSLLLLRRARVLAQDAPLDQANKEDRATAEAIVKGLDGLPLALDQAGAYIEETQCGLVGYLDLYSTRRSELLKRRSRLRTEHPEPVATTWSLSFQQVEQANPAAADLLRLCAFLDPDAIPEEIIIEGASELGSVLSPAAADPFKLNEAIEELRRFSLIWRNPAAKLLNIHRLVQTVLKNGMNTETQQMWAERAVRAVNQVFPDERWLPIQHLLPHALTCAELIKQYHLESAEAAKLLDRAAGYFRDYGRYNQAEPLFQQALEIKEKVLGPDHINTATTLNNLATLYRNQGQYAQAEPLFQRALAIFEKALSPDHLYTATTLSNLGQLYRAKRQYVQAESLHQRALTIREKELPADHPYIGITLQNLAVIYKSQGQYTQAESLYKRALAIYEKALPSSHPDIATTLSNLAKLHKAQGQYVQAEPLYERSLAIREKVFGPEHPKVATVLESYADLLRKMNRSSEAAQLEARAKAIRTKSSS